LRLAPYIEDVVATENYVRLFVPYQPGKYNELMKKLCPAALTAKAANHGEGMACLAKILDIRLDGKPVAVPLMASVDVDTRQRGMVAMIDVRKLADGQHVLKITAVPKKSDENQAAAKYHQIPFWK